MDVTCVGRNMVQSIRTNTTYRPLKRNLESPYAMNGLTIMFRTTDTAAKNMLLKILR